MTTTNPPIPVLISGLPGNMATLVARTLQANDRFLVIPYALVGPETTAISIDVAGLPFVTIRSEREAELTKFKACFPDLIIVDYSVPSAVNENAELFCKVGIPFIMGTTSGDRDALRRTVEMSDIPAVISPNMSPAIVLLMAMIEYGAKTFPGALKDFSIEIVESHQATKKDKSGTADKVGELFKELGVDYRGEDSIEAIRTEEEQLALGVLEEHLGGHGWHSYKLVSPDRSVELGFVHDVNGRQTYVDGTVRAIEFLIEQIEKRRLACFSDEPLGNYYTMIDALKV